MQEIFQRYSPSSDHLWPVVLSFLICFTRCSRLVACRISNHGFFHLGAFCSQRDRQPLGLFFPSIMGLWSEAVYRYGPLQNQVHTSLASMRVSLVSNILLYLPNADYSPLPGLQGCRILHGILLYHPKVWYYRQGTTGKVKRCGKCLKRRIIVHTQTKTELISRLTHGRYSCSQKEAITMYGWCPIRPSTT